MFFNNFLHDCQSKSSTFVPCRDIGFEKTRTILWQSDPIVINYNLNIIANLFNTHVDFPRNGTAQLITSRVNRFARVFQ